MSVSDSSDSEKSSGLEDWTLVHPFDENEEKEDEPTMLTSQPDSSIRDETLPNENIQLETKIQEVDDNEQKKSEASDFECIAEDETEENFFRNSKFSIDRITGFDIENISSGSYSVVADDESSDLSSTFCSSCKDEELPINLEVHRMRTYIHKPNRRLNVILSLVLILSFTLVCGLGIGHFLGWSNRWSQQYRLHQIHVKQLTALQDEMFNCLQSRDIENEVKVCYEKVDNWKKIFEDILLENHELHDFIIQNGINVDGEQDDEKCDDSNLGMVGEYRNLKFHLINQQLENMESLKQMEIFKKQEKEANDKVKKLEHENEELKYLINDEEDKEEILILQLENENQELRQELADLKITLLMEEEEDNQTHKEIGTLHQKINNLLVENSDLQHVIAKLRYSQPLDQDSEKVTDNAHEKVEGAANEESAVENLELNANEVTEDGANVNEEENASENEEENVKENTNKNEEESANENVGKNSNDWWFENTGWPDLQMEGFINHLLKIATDKNIAQNEFNQFQENLQMMYEDLKTKAEKGLITGKDILKQVHQELESKIQAVINTNLSNAALSAETIELIGKTLTDSVSKLYKIGSEGLFSEENRKKGASEINKFHKKIEGVLIKMEKQWEIIWGKVWSLPVQKDKNAKSESKTNAEFIAASSINKVEDVSDKGSLATKENLPPKAENVETPKIKNKKETSDSKLKKTSKFTEKDNEKAKNEKKSNSKNVEKKNNSKNEEKKNSKNKEKKTNFKREEKNQTRSQSRKKVENNNNSWLLERGSNRQKARIEALNQSKWYFQRPKYKQSSDKNKEKDKKSSKKKNNKHCDSDDDDNSDNEDEKYCKKAAKDLRKKRSDWQKNSNRQRNLEFRIPEPVYYSF